jgi:guanylate kinase
MKIGFIFVISGPSAVGKSSIADEMLRTKGNSLHKVITLKELISLLKFRGKNVQSGFYKFMSFCI